MMTKRQQEDVAMYLMDRADQYDTKSPCWVALSDAAHNIVNGSVEAGLDYAGDDPAQRARVRKWRRPSEAYRAIRRAGGYTMMSDDVLAVGQDWLDEDGDMVEIIAIDGPPYPVQFKWKDGGQVGRDTVDGFLSSHSQPTPWWLERLATLQAERDAARRERDKAHRVHRSLTDRTIEAKAERDRLKAALQRIGQVENDTGNVDDDVCYECQGWVKMANQPRNGRPSCGTDCPGGIARRAVAAAPSITPPAGTLQHECPSCDLDDSVKVPDGKLLKSTPIKRATPAVQGEPPCDVCKGYLFVGRTPCPKCNPPEPPRCTCPFPRDKCPQCENACHACIDANRHPREGEQGRCAHPKARFLTADGQHAPEFWWCDDCQKAVPAPGTRPPQETR